MLAGADHVQSTQRIHEEAKNVVGFFGVQFIQQRRTGTNAPQGCGDGVTGDAEVQQFAENRIYEDFP